jgi:hypothetical protein
MRAWSSDRDSRQNSETPKSFLLPKTAFDPFFPSRHKRAPPSIKVSTPGIQDVGETAAHMLGGQRTLSEARHKAQKLSGISRMLRGIGEPAPRRELPLQVYRRLGE